MVFVCNINGMTEVELAKLLAKDLGLRLEINEFGLQLYLNTHFVDSVSSLIKIKLKDKILIRAFVISEKLIFNKIRKKARKLSYIQEFKDGILPTSLFKQTEGAEIFLHWNYSEKPVKKKTGFFYKKKKGPYIKYKPLLVEVRRGLIIMQVGVFIYGVEIGSFLARAISFFKYNAR